MNALLFGLRLGVIAFFVLGACALALAVVRAERRGIEDAHLLWAIAERETGNNPHAVGRRGEFTAWQFKAGTWHDYTDMTPADGVRNPAAAYAVAEAHLDWLRGCLRRAGLKPTPYRLALSWHAGIGATVKGDTTASQRTYAQDVANLVAVAP